MNETTFDAVRAVGRRAAAGLVLAALAGTALAHGGEEESTAGLAPLHSRAVAAALFLVGLGLFAASIALARGDRVGNRTTDAGVALGVVCVLGSVVAYVV